MLNQMNKALETISRMCICNNRNKIESALKQTSANKQINKQTDRRTDGQTNPHK